MALHGIQDLPTCPTVPLSNLIFSKEKEWVYQTKYDIDGQFNLILLKAPLFTLLYWYFIYTYLCHIARYPPSCEWKCELHKHARLNATNN